VPTTLAISWPNPRHFLLQGASVELAHNNSVVAPTASLPGAEVFRGIPTVSGSTLRLKLSFKPRIAGQTVTTLAIEQEWSVGVPHLSPTHHVVQVAGARRRQRGLHPLLSVALFPLRATVMVNAGLVDATVVADNAFGRLRKLSRPSPPADVRVLARTDGAKPQAWVVATPPRSQGAPRTDMLAFFGPQQDTPKYKDKLAEYTGPGAAFDNLVVFVSTFLGGGVHTGFPDIKAADHFTPQSGTDPNVVIPRNVEASLMESGKTVAIAIPVPGEGKHANAEATAAQLREVHRVLRALGLVAAAEDQVVEAPLLGAAGYSNGALGLWAAIDPKAGTPHAFRELWAIEGLKIQKHVDDLIDSGANVCLVGYNVGTVHDPFKALGNIAKRRFPDPPVRDTGSTMAQLVASSGLLKHAIDGGNPPVSADAATWNPPFRPKPDPRFPGARFWALHLAAMFGDDPAGKRHFRRALETSVFP
jgi:hypothetical protein